MISHTWLRACLAASLLGLTSVSFLGCNDSDDTLPENPKVTHVLKSVSVTQLGDGYRLTSQDNEGKASIVNGPPSNRELTLRQFYEGMLYAPTDIILEATIDGTVQRWTGQIELLSRDISSRNSTYSFTKVSAYGGGSVVGGEETGTVAKASSTLPSQMDEGTLVLQSCSNSYPTCSGDYQCDGGECCPTTCGTITSQGKVGFCWSWERLSCHPCQDYTSYCYSDGICGGGRLLCPNNGCVADTEPCYGSE